LSAGWLFCLALMDFERTACQSSYLYICSLCSENRHTSVWLIYQADPPQILSGTWAKLTKLNKTLCSLLLRCLFRLRTVTAMQWPDSELSHVTRKLEVVTAPIKQITHILSHFFWRSLYRVVKLLFLSLLFSHFMTGRIEVPHLLEECKFATIVNVTALYANKDDASQRNVLITVCINYVTLWVNWRS